MGTCITPVVTPGDDGLDEPGSFFIPCFRPVLYDGVRQTPPITLKSTHRGEPMCTESFWADNDLERRITDILSTNARRETEHHFGPSFVTAYQLAILLKAGCPAVFERFGHPVGGRGAGDHVGFAQYIARQLSQRIRSGEITSIEGRFLSYEHVRQLEFDDAGVPVIASSNGTRVSMFRCREPYRT